MSCFSADDQSHPARELFTLGLGALEDEIRLFGTNESGDDLIDDFMYHRGFFYLANTQGKKVMVLSSGGTLLKSWYNKSTNPTPYSLAVLESAEPETIRYARPFSFVNPTYLALGLEEELYVVDNVSPKDRIVDRENSRVLDRVILRFDRQGLFQDQLGQEGVGGRPFSFVTDLAVFEDGGIGVITREISHWSLFWYSKLGEKQLETRISEEELTAFLPLEDNQLLSIDRLWFAPDGQDFFTKVTVFRRNLDQGTRVVNNIEVDRVLVMRFDRDSGQSTGEFSLPLIIDQESTQDRGEFAPSMDSPLEFLGQTAGEAFVFLAYRPQGEILLTVMDFTGQLLYQDELSLPLEYQEITNFYLHPEGNVYGMASNGYEMKFYTWDLAPLIGSFDGKTR
jgi:hypothetical protein